MEGTALCLPCTIAMEEGDALEVEENVQGIAEGARMSAYSREERTFLYEK